ncbi:MAG: hypothetical protein EAZ74_00220 [Alphaproteobacteria bacterium]|nr:MAG: hypothetical protein EAY76_05305 [Alphaproteobacteria bacterium]TAF16087.1 MAG: hypothetical protein EAZ74_00220 [Alphaproteobacteria bacterium]TAF75905.1 MAG: hypothetical protein EAZ52_05415 [Alphaproteobacteria bacterium]
MKKPWTEKISSKKTPSKYDRIPADQAKNVADYVTKNGLGNSIEASKIFIENGLEHLASGALQSMALSEFLVALSPFHSLASRECIPHSNREVEDMARAAYMLAYAVATLEGNQPFREDRAPVDMYLENDRAKDSLAIHYATKAKLILGDKHDLFGDKTVELFNTIVNRIEEHRPEIRKSFLEQIILSDRAVPTLKGR